MFKRLLRATRVDVWAVLFLVFFTGVFISQPGQAKFVDWSQRGDLFVNGALTNDTGNRFDILVVPGYYDTLQESGRGFRLGYGSISEYATADPYWSAGESISYGHEVNESILVDYMWWDTIDEINDNFSRANKARENNTIGWGAAYFWSAVHYPTALVESVVETAGKLTWGTVKLGTTSSFNYVVRPAAHLTFPTFKTGYYVGYRGTVKPTSEVLWHTTAGNSVILLGGQVPTKETADGYWVQRVNKFRRYSR